MSKSKLPADPRDYYVHNECSLAELAALYSGQKGCSLANLKIRCKKENWVKQLDQNYTKTQEKLDQKLTDLASENVLLTKERLLEELCFMAYVKMDDYVTIEPGGGVLIKTFEEMPPGTSRAIHKIKEKKKIIEPTEGEGKSVIIESQVEFGHHDKLKAIDKICELMGYNKPEPPKPLDPNGQKTKQMGYKELYDLMPSLSMEAQIFLAATGRLPEPQD